MLLLIHEAKMLIENKISDLRSRFFQWSSDSIYGMAIEFDQVKDLKGNFQTCYQVQTHTMTSPITPYKQKTIS